MLSTIDIWMWTHSNGNFEARPSIWNPFFAGSIFAFQVSQTMQVFIWFYMYLLKCNRQVPVAVVVAINSVDSEGLGDESTFCSIFRAATPDIQNLTSDTFRKCTVNLDLEAVFRKSGPHFLSLSYHLAMGPMGPWDNGPFLSAAKRDFCQREPPSQGWWNVGTDETAKLVAC